MVFYFHDGDIEPILSSDTPPDFTATPVSALDWSRLAPRPWLYGYELMRGMVSVLGGTGGVGKSAYTIAVALAVASGRNLLGYRVHRRVNTWLYNLEDPLHELQLRVAAASRHHNVPLTEVETNLYLDSGRDQDLMIATRDTAGNVMRSPVVDKLIAVLRDREIGLLIVDPLAYSHGLDENMNGEIAQVARLWAQVASDANAAVWLIHHFRKGGQAGDADSFRGASALQGAARIMRTMVGMSVEDAARLNVSDENRRNYVRIDNAKNNMSRSASSAEWYKLIGVDLANGTPEYPNGDQVQSVEMWEPRSKHLSTNDLRRVVDQISTGPSPGRFYSESKNSGDRYIGLAIQQVLRCSEEDAASTYRWLLAEQHVRRGNHVNPDTRKMVSCVVAGHRSPCDDN